MAWIARCWLLVLFAICAVAQPLPPIPTDVGAALDAMPVQAAVEGGVRVVATLGDQAVAEADVFVIDSARAAPFTEALRGSTHERGSHHVNSLLALWIGVRYRTSADGAVAVALPEVGATVLVRTSSAVGVGRVRPDQAAAALSVALQRYREVRVHVQDARGRALADAPVAVAWRTQNYVSRSYAGRTDAQGLLIMAVDDEPTHELVACVDCICATPAFVVVPRGADGGCAPLTLIAPPTGMVRVLAYDDAERPRSGVRDVRLRVVGATNVANRHDGFASPKLEPEGAMFRWVALEQQLAARVAFTGVVGELTVTGPGPTHAGELVVLALRSKLAEPVVQVRVLDQQGEPLRDTALAVVRGSQQSCTTFAATTGPDGHLDIVLSDDWRAAAVRGLLLVRRDGRGQAPTEYLGAADLNALAAKPPADRSDVRLLPEPEMLRGRVVDHDGRPLGEVVVQVAYSWTASRPDQSFSSSGQVNLTHLVKTDADGRFAVREVAPKDVPLTIDAPRARPDLTPAEVVMAAPGRTDVTLTLLRGGSLAVELPGWPPGVRLQASLRQGDRVHAWQGVEADGRLVFTGVPPGKWAVMFHSLVALELRDIDVPAGGASTDPRLRIADWRDRVLLVDTKVTSPEGLPLDVGVSIVVEKPGSSSSTGTSSTGGRVLLAIPRDTTRVTLSHPKYQSVDLDVRNTQAEVRMRPRGLVRFKLREGVSLPEGLDLMIHYAQRNTGAESLKWSKGRTLECAVPGPGGVTFMVLLRSEVAPGRFANRSLWQTSLTIKPDRAAQDLDLDLTPEDAERITELFLEARQAETEAKRAGK